MTIETIKEFEQNIETLVVAFEKETGMEVVCLSVNSRTYPDPHGRITASLRRIVDSEKAKEVSA